MVWHLIALLGCCINGTLVYSQISNGTTQALIAVTYASVWFLCENTMLLILQGIMRQSKDSELL